MTDLKREYVVPLRRKTSTAPKWRRSKKAVSVLKDFIKKHMKTDNVILCAELNDKIWENGIKNPPGKVSVIALKTTLGNEEKTLVNLAEVGLDEQLKKYATTQVPVKEAKTETKDGKEVVDVEAKEVKKEESAKKTETKKEKAPAKEKTKEDKKE